MLVCGLGTVMGKSRERTPSANILEDNKEATETAKEATVSAIVGKIVEKKEDITESTPEIKGKLESYLAEHPLKPLTVTNFLQHAIRSAVKKDVAANTIVLILLFVL